MCESGFLKVRNWDRFQHYKDRNPPWIKLATDTFQNYDFSRLDDASKLLAVCIWTLASRSEVSEFGSVPNDLQWIKSQCGLGETVTKKSLQALIDKGFMALDTKVLADRKQNACLEVETETETEEEERHNIPQIKNHIIDVYNSFASKNSKWAKCSKIPSGEAGKLLDGRAREPEWIEAFPEQMTKAIEMLWITKGTLTMMLRPDHQRKILDGEWGKDPYGKKTFDQKRDIAMKPEGYDGPFA